MLKGIDISMHQPNIDLATINADFVIVKASEGVGYTDPLFEQHVANTIASGKRLGLYHFARNDLGNTGTQEATWYVSLIKPYINKAVLVLDWESALKHDVAWAKQWLDTVYSLTGIKPMIYMSESVVNSYDWSSVANANYGLWVARYRDYEIDYDYDMSNSGPQPNCKYWEFVAMWQWTSSGVLGGYNGNLDCNVFYGDVVAWDKYANATSAPIPTPVPTPKPQPSGIKVGSSVNVINPYDENGTKLYVTGTYVVIELNGNRAVIGRNGIVICAINTDNLSAVSGNEQTVTNGFRVPSSLPFGSRFWISENASVYGGNAYGTPVPEFIKKATTLYRSGGTMQQNGFDWVLASEINSWVKVSDCLIK